MKVTQVSVRKSEQNENSRLKGIASVVVDDCFAIHDIKIIDGSNRLFIAMPSRKMTDGTYKDICHPINPDTRELFENAILEEFNKE